MVVPEGKPSGFTPTSFPPANSTRDPSASSAARVCSNSRETAELVSVAILELRMKLNGIDDTELKALCDELTMRAEDEDRPRELKSAHSHRRRPLLRLVK